MPSLRPCPVAKDVRVAFACRGTAIGLMLAVAAFLSLSNLNCDGNSPTRSPNQNSIEALAGGGRAGDSDPFIGGPEYSGPRDDGGGRPPIDPATNYWPLVMLSAACGDAPAHVVLTDSSAWRTWWELNVCASEDDTRPDWGGRAPSDSGAVEPDSSDPGPLDPPWVDFAHDVIVAVTLERANADPRYLMIEDVSPTATGTAVRYAVYRPGVDCPREGGDSLAGDTTAPAIAVPVPGPLPPPFSWLRRDTTYSCSWEPDPAVPAPVYYTDAPCDLGPAEQILTTQEAFDAWLSRALTCDAARWDWREDSTWVPGDSSETPDPDYPVAYSIPIDFARFAVVVLRAGDQERWGGGIWLTDLKPGDGGTDVSYVVAVPGPDCPLVADGGYWNHDAVNPTVAIRVLLPLPEPIHWNRSALTLACAWEEGSDSTIVVDRDSVSVP